MLIIVLSWRIVAVGESFPGLRTLLHIVFHAFVSAFPQDALRVLARVEACLDLWEHLKDLAPGHINGDFGSVWVLAQRSLSIQQTLLLLVAANHDSVLHLSSVCLFQIFGIREALSMLELGARLDLLRINCLRSRRCDDLQARLRCASFSHRRRAGQRNLVDRASLRRCSDRRIELNLERLGGVLFAWAGDQGYLPSLNLLSGAGAEQRLCRSCTPRRGNQPGNVQLLSA